MTSYVCILSVWCYFIDQDIIEDILGVFTTLDEAIAFCKSHKDIHKSDTWIEIVEFTGSIRGKETLVNG